MTVTPRKTIQGVLLAGALVVLGLGIACYPGSIENVQETDVIVTRRDTSANFASFLLYAMPDTVVQINDTAEGAVELPHDNDSLIVALVEQNLAALGYVRVNIPDPPAQPSPDSVPSFYLLVSAAAYNVSYYTYYPGWGYWGWWPGWGYYPGYGPGWGWGYPGYIGKTSFDQGTLFMDFVEPTTQDTIPVLWTGALRGILTGSGAAMRTRLVDGIHQAFIQSPYLGRN